MKPSKMADEAISATWRLLEASGRFADLAYGEVRKIYRKVPWMGMYERDSIDREAPLYRLAVNNHIDCGKDADDPIKGMTDTLLHEVGHACWDLLADESKAEWEADEQVREYRYGPEEAFAEDFKDYMTGQRIWMNNETLFEIITRPDTTGA